MRRVELSGSLGGSVFLSQLGRVLIPARGERVEVEVYVGGGLKPVFYETYVVDDAVGGVELSGLDVLLRPYFGDEPCIDVAVSAGGAVVWRGVVYWCVRSFTGSAGDWVACHFLKSSGGVAFTSAGRREVLSYYHLGLGESVCVSVEYYDAGRGSVVRRGRVLPVQVSGALASVDVSPLVFEDMRVGELVAYTVSAGDRVQRYEVLPFVASVRPSVRFRNALGVWEWFHFVGEVEYAPVYNRESVVVCGCERVYSCRESAQLVCHSGTLNAEGVARAYDLAGVGECVTSEGVRLVVEDAKVKHSDAPGSVPDFEFTFRLADDMGAPLLDGGPGGGTGVFDVSFDNSFE